MVVYDKDHQAYKDLCKKNQADKDSALIESNIIPTLGCSVIFDNDIEEEIGILDDKNKNKPFIALQEVSNERFVTTTQLDKKIKIIYS